MTSSLNGEKPGKPVQKAKPTSAELRVKVESEASPLKVPNAPEFLSKCAQQSARLPLASQTLYENQSTRLRQAATTRKCGRFWAANWIHIICQRLKKNMEKL